MMSHEDIVFEMAKYVVYEFLKLRITSPKYKAAVLKNQRNITISLNYIKEKTYFKAWKNGVSRRDVTRILDDKSYIVQLAEVIQKNLITTCRMILVPDCEIKISYTEYKRATLPFIEFEDVLNDQKYDESIIKSMVKRIDDRMERIQKVYRCNWVVEDKKHYDFENVSYD